MGLIECFTAVCLASIARMPGDRLGVVGLRRRCDVDRRHHLDVITAILNYDAEPRHLLMLERGRASASSAIFLSVRTAPMTAMPFSDRSRTRARLNSLPAQIAARKARRSA